MVLDAKKEKGKAYTLWCDMEMFKNYFSFFFLLLVGALIFELLLWIVFECRNKWLISLTGLDWTGGPFEISSPAGACLCRNLNKCVGNTYHFHDTAKITFEVCHNYVIKIHTDMACSVSKISKTTIFLELRHTGASRIHLYNVQKI